MAIRKTKACGWVFLFLFCGIVFGDVWKYEQIAGGRNFNDIGRNAIALDASGKVHISYYGSGLYHCWQESSGWNFENIEGMSYGGSASIATEAGGDNLILRGAKFARGGDGVYSVEEIDTYPSDYLRYPDMAIDPGGGVHAVYFGEDYPYWHFYYATNTSGSWQVEEICSANEYKQESAAIALDSFGRPHISAMVPDGVSSHLEHHYYNGSSWQSEQIKETYDSDGTGIFIDGEDNVYIVFTDYDSHWNISYADNTTGLWRDQVMVDEPSGDYRYYNPRLTVDPCGVVHTVYLRGRSQVYHSYGQWSSWTDEQIADCNIISNVSLAADANGLMHLAFLEKDTSYSPYLYRLNYGSGESGSWDLSEVDVVLGTDGFSFLELDSGDEPKVMYRENVRDELIVADRIGDDDWSLEKVPTGRTPMGGGRFGMGLDGSDAVHIAYQGWSYSDPYEVGLGYMTNATGSWVEDYNNVTYCHMPSIAVNSAGVAKLTRYRNVYDYVTMVFYTDPVPGAWNTQVLDVVTDANGICDEDYVWSDMQCDAWGGYHIAYVFGGDNGIGGYRYDVKYGYSSGTGFSLVTVESDVGRYARPMLSVDGFGNVHIAWANAELGSFRYATDATGSWQVENIPAEGENKKTFLDIASDSLGRPNVAIGMDNRIFIASKIAGVWELEDATGNFEFELNNDTVSGPSIGVDTADKIHLSFYRNVNDEDWLYYATNAVVAPVVSVDPNAMHFLAMEGTTVDESVEIRNTGNGDLHVSLLEIVGPDSDKFGVTASGVTLPPGGLAIRNVSFSSAVRGSYEAVLRVNSDDNQRPAVDVGLTASCLAVPTGVLSTKYSYFDLGEVVVGQTGEEVTVRIQNTGMVSVSVAYALSDTNDFNCTRFVPPLTLGAGESLYIDVWLEPESVGAKDCVLYVSGSLGSYLEIAFSGEGAAVPMPGVSLAADSNELEAILPGGGDSGDISIRNTGDADLEIVDLQMTNTSEFTVDPNGGKNPLGTVLPVFLPPGEIRTMTVTFETDVIGQYATEVTLQCNIPGKYVTLGFSGDAYAWDVCDFDLDGDVDFGDFSTLAYYWQFKPGEYIADVYPEGDGDGRVNGDDLMYFSESWLEVKDAF